MRTVTLVPFRGGPPFRDDAWRCVRPYLEGLGYPLYVGDAPGPWARSAACNAAARAAGDWDIAVVADADSILEPEAVERAVARIGRTKGGARPHDKRWMLMAPASRLVMRHGIEALRPGDLVHTAPGGGALVIHRKAWERVGGYPEDYVGWGYEDSALNISLAVETFWEILPGNAYHLYHPHANLTSATSTANRARLDAHRARHAAAIKRLSLAAGYDLNKVL